MRLKQGDRLLRDVREREVPRAHTAVDSLDRAIDETIRWQLMSEDPPARAYVRVLEAVGTAVPVERDDVSFRTWTIGAASVAAAVLLVVMVLRTAGLISLAVDTDSPSRGALMLDWLSSTSLATWINESETVLGYSGILFLHTFGLAVVVGLSMAVDLRLLGPVSRMSLRDLQSLFRFIWFGFWVNALSGTLLFIANAPGKMANPLFEAKLVLVALGVMVMALIERRLHQAHRAGVTPSASRLGLRALAGTSLLLWVAAIAAGRLIAYAL
jgi:hypothetical protein